MNGLYIAFLLFVTNTVFAFQTKVIFKNNLSFMADSLKSIDRQNEVFTGGSTDPQIERLILSTVNNTVKLIPPKYLPPLLTINYEQNALFTKTGKAAEQIPLSMVLTFQTPTLNEIRYSDFETKVHPEDLKTNLAHEVGHMLIEWACRAKGVTKPTDKTVLSSHWVSSIYEGVADYISATVNDTTVIGTPGAWYSRDILKFKTLEEAHQRSISTVKLVENGWMQAGLIPSYQTYVDLIAEFKKQASDETVGDGYVEAPWLAGQLWQLNRVYDSKSVFGAILEIAISGKKFTSPELFLNEIKLKLKK